MEFVLALILCFLAGAAIGGQLNRGIYRLAYFSRQIGPWSKPHKKARRRSWQDRIPIVGWWRLRRESKLHGRGYWVRPMLLELFFGAGMAALFWWEMSGGLYPPGVSAAQIDVWTLGAQFAAHAVLISFMVMATFIDYDEQMIPDAVTVPCTLIGLVLAAALPAMRLPVGGGGFLNLTSPMQWPVWLDESQGLVIGLAIFAAWCLALCPATWTTRRGFAKAMQWWCASLRRNPFAWRYLAMMPVGCIGVAVVWAIGGAYWESLLSALVGLGFGGALVWSVRIIAGGALGKEAMGFGDVTLMAMIGVFVGWQSTLIVFFMAPFFGVLIALAQLVIMRRSDIAYGPYLCIAALYLIIDWARFWIWAYRIFESGWLVPAVVAFCLALMGIMLFAIAAVKGVLGLDGRAAGDKVIR